MIINTEPSYAQAEWHAFLAELERVVCELGEADRTAHENDDDDLRGWMDDLQDRVGLNVDAARVLLEAYISASNAQIARDVSAMDEPETLNKSAVVLDDRELATMLAALRFYQQAGMHDAVNRGVEIDDIATCGGTLEPLDGDGIDALCERLNTPAHDRDN